MERKLKDEENAVHFKKATDQTPAFLELIPSLSEQRRQLRSVLHYKNWLLAALALVSTVLLLVLVLTERPGKDDFPFNVVTSGGNESTVAMAGPLALVVDSTTTTTTERTTTERHLKYILASIIVNNASVPQMDRSFLGQQYSQADPYVELHVLDGQKARRVGQTPVQKNTLSPKWNYLFEHEMALSADALLEFELFDEDRVNADERIGKLLVRVRDLLAGGRNGVMERRQYGRGSLWFTVHWREVYD